MAVHVDVYAELDNSSIRRSANDIQRDLQRAGDEGGKGLERGITAAAPKVEKALDRAANATGKVRVEQEKYNKVLDEYNDAVKRGDGDRSKLVTHFERLATAQRGQSSAIRDVTTAMRDAEVAGQSLANVAEGTTSTLTELGAAVGKLSNIAAPVAIVGLSAAAIELAGVAASATQALWLIPAAAGAAGAAIGTIALATYGFGDALKAVGDPQKFAEALQQLSPNAQQAALSIQQLMPAFTQLREATSNAFFANVGPQINQLVNQFLPTIQSMTTGIAGAFNQMFSGVAQQLMTPQTQQAIQAFTTNITAAFQNLAPAMGPIVSAFAEIAKVGSGALPGMAQAVAQLATQFSSFISQKAATGELARWLNEGLDTVKQLVPAAVELGKAFMSLAPMGRELLPDIVTALKSINSIMPAISAAAVLLGPPFGLWEATIGNIGDKFDAIKGIATSVGNVVIPVFNNIAQAASDMLAPIRAAAALVGITIPDFKPISQISSGSTGNGTPGVNRTALGGSTLPTAGLDPFTGLPLPAGMGGLGSSLASNRSTEVSGWSGKPVFGSASGGGGGGSTGLPGAPALPYDTSLPAGYANLPQTAEIVSAENSWMDARHTLAEKQARVNQLEKDTTATADDITKAKNDVINAQQAQNQTELRLQDARQSLYDKANKQLDGYATQMGEIGAKLDQDLGISKGLPGLADNLVRFLGNLALAGPLAQMNALANAPGQAQGGYGLMGVLGAQGAFGSQYTAAGQAAASGQSSASASAMGPAALQPGAASYAGGAYPGDAALLANVPAGSYSQTQAADLTKGIGDCSSAVEDLVNILQGRPTGGRSMATGNEAEWLTQHGFQPGAGGPGDFRVGFNSGHTQATLPGGTPFNWGSDSAAANRGIGGSGASDPAFTSHYYLPVGGAAPDPYAPAAAPGGGNLYSPANTSPGLNNPPAPAGGGWGMPGLPSNAIGGAGQGPLMTPPGPGVGAGAGAGGPQLGGVEPYSNPSGGGFGITSGGMIDTAMSVAASAFPGLGQAAQTGMKLANRAIQFAGQATGIGIQGALDTFIPWGGSELASKNWITRGLGAAAGASPALPNMAGKAASAPKGQEGQGQQGGPGQTGGPVNQGVQIMGDYHQHGTEDQASADLSSHLTAQNTRPGP